MDDQLELFLRLEPGIQHIESVSFDGFYPHFMKVIAKLYEDFNLQELGNMPPQPVFESNNRNLTATEAFLRFAEIKDNEISLYMAFGSAMIWNGWRNARKYFGLLQTQYRNQVKPPWIWNGLHCGVNS